MKQWHESLAANLGLRAAGIGLLVTGWSIGVRLHQIALGVSARDPSSLMMLLAAIVFICGSAGSALLFVGPGLWETIEVSGRWRHPPAPDFETPTCLDREA